MLRYNGYKYLVVRFGSYDPVSSITALTSTGKKFATKNRGASDGGGGGGGGKFILCHLPAPQVIITKQARVRL